MKDTNALIYVVEDDEGIQEVYDGAFEDEYLVKIFSSGKEFFEVFEKVKPDTDAQTVLSILAQA